MIFHSLKCYFEFERSRNITNWLQVNHIAHEAVVLSIWKFVTYRQRHFEILNMNFTKPFEIKLFRPTLKH